MRRALQNQLSFSLGGYLAAELVNIQAIYLADPVRQYSSHSSADLSGG